MVNGKKKGKDVTVQETNDSSILSKASIVELGYFDDPYLKIFCKRIACRSPLIHRGYYIRAKAIDYILQAFLEQTTHCESIQIVSLGAGFDTSFFRLKSKITDRLKKCHFIEIDFPNVVKRKQAIFQKSELLQSLTGEFSIDSNGVLHSTNFTILPCDLTDTRKLRKLFNESSFTFEVPTLIFSECVLTYIEYEKSRELLSWIEMTFPHVVVAVYEQFSPNDPFGCVMLKHFEKIQSPLRRIKHLESINKHKSFLESLSYENVVGFDMNFFYRMYLDEAEKSRMTNLEVFDEFEEWHLKCSHYCIIAGFKGSCKDMAKLMFPRQPLLSVIDELKRKVITPKHLSDYGDVMRFGHEVTKLENDQFIISGGFGVSKSGGHCRLKNGIVLKILTPQVSDRTETFFQENVSDNISKQSHEQISMPERLFHTATQIVNQQIFLFGGRRSPTKPVKLYGLYEVLDHEGELWEIRTIEERELDDDFSPSGRWRHSAVYFQGRVFIYGGIGESNLVFNELWNIDMSSFKWKKLTLSDPLPPCHSHTLNIWREYLVLYGGIKSNMESLNTLFLLTHIKEEIFNIQQIECIPPLPKRYSHTSHIMNDKLVVIGGVDPTDQTSPPVIIIDLVKKKWKPIFLPLCEKSNVLMLHNHRSIITNKGVVFVVGGGGNCFSFGTHFNRNIVCLDLSSELFSCSF